LLRLQSGQQYSNLPWYRKSAYVSWITALGLCCSPAILAVCIIVLTGEVYYNQMDATGNLKKWGYANKVVALIILAFQVLFYAVQIVAVIAAPARP